MRGGGEEEKKEKEERKRNVVRTGRKAVAKK